MADRVENHDDHTKAPLAATRLQDEKQDAGLFPPQGMLRKVLGESIGMVGGGCDLLLQIAHPLVAAGVSDHSRFQYDPLARLRGTIDTLLGIVFGELGYARTTLQSFNHVHVRVQGVLAEQAGRFPAGTTYSGHDPELKLWVHASLIHTQLRVYELFVARLSDAEREQYYQESKLLAWRLGIPRALIPDTLADFNSYVDAMVNGADLAITPGTLALSRLVLRPPNVWFGARLLMLPTGFITAALLPERLRREYKLPWNHKRQVIFNVVCKLSRLLTPITPAPLRYLPRARSSRLFRLVMGEKVGAGSREQGAG